jgi:hypothetical protein
MRGLVTVFVALLMLHAAGLEAQLRDAWPSTLLLDAATTTVSGAAFKPPSRQRTFQVYGETSSGAGSATVVIEVSNIEAPGTNDWILASTIVLTLSTTRTTDGFASIAPWRNVRARVTAISGTGATVSARMGS